MSPTAAPLNRNKSLNAETVAENAVSAQQTTAVQVSSSANEFKHQLSLYAGLTQAVKANDLAQVQTQLQAKANPNLTNGTATVTPLWLAVQNGSVDIAKALLSAGASMFYASVKASTPYKLAQEQAANNPAMFAAFEQVRTGR